MPVAYEISWKGKLTVILIISVQNICGLVVVLHASGAAHVNSMWQFNIAPEPPHAGLLIKPCNAAIDAHLLTDACCFYYSIFVYNFFQVIRD